MATMMAVILYLPGCLPLMLSQQAIADAVSAAIQAGVSQPRNAAGLEEALITLRSRIRTAGRVDALGQQKVALGRALQPLVLA